MASFSKFKQQLKTAVKRVTKVDAWPATVVRAGTAPARSVVKFTNGLELEVLNYRFSSVADLKVDVGYDPLLPGVLQVLGIRESINLIGQASSWSFWLPEHHANHEFPNPDTVWVHGAQFVPLNVVPVSGLTVRIYGSVLRGDGEWVAFQTETLDLTSHQPATGALYALIELDETGAAVVTDGATKDSRFSLTAADIPEPTAGRTPICAIRLYDGQTKIYHDVRVGKPNDVTDLRWNRYANGGLADLAKDLDIANLPVEASPTSGDKLVIDRAGVRSQIDWDDLPAGGGGANWSDIDSATADTPLDADKFGFWDVVDAALKSITWTDIKATLKTYFDTLYAAVANGVTNGDSHDHNGGDGAQIAHANLSGVGTNTHATIDTHLASTSNPHSVTAAQAVAIPESGWIERSETWTRTDNHTFTLTGDQTATYRKGRKVRYKDGGSYEYGVIKSATYDGGTDKTTVTLIANDDYAMAAGAISDTALSDMTNPPGFPDYFNYTPILSCGGSMTISSSTINLACWRADGSMMTIWHNINLKLGGTAAKELYVSLPATPLILTPIVGNSRDTGSGVVPVGTALVSTVGNAIHRKADVTNWTVGGSSNAAIIGIGSYPF